MAPADVEPAGRKSTSCESDDNNISVPRPMLSKRIPGQEWEKKRPIITRLYQEEKKSLKEVMGILKQEHNFTATVKMYKSRIYKWGLDKKLKSDEVLAILTLKAERDAQGKPSEFTIRGQPVDLDNISRYIRRNPSLIPRFYDRQVPSNQATLEVQCHTPHPSPQAPPASAEISLVERVLGLFEEYIQDCFSSDIWEYEYNSFCRGHWYGDRSDDLFNRVMLSLPLIDRSMMRKDDTLTDSILTPVFGYLKEIIASESPIFVIRTACLLWHLDRFYKHNLFRTIVNYIMGLVPIILDRENPLVRIWEILSSTQFTEYSELARRVYSTFIPIMDARVGPANSLMVILYEDHLDYLITFDRLADSHAIATKYQARAKATGLEHPWLINITIARIAVQCRIMEREGKFMEASQCLQSLKFEYNMGEKQEAALNLQLGNYSYRMGDFALAVQRFQEAMRLAVASDSEQLLLLTCLVNLECTFYNTGQSDEAAKIQQYRLTRISDFGQASRTFDSPFPSFPSR